MSYQGFTITGRGDWYISQHGLTLPKPIDMRHFFPHQVGRELSGRLIYQGYEALEADWSWLSGSTMQALYVYYLVGDDTNAPVTIGFVDPYQSSNYVTMTGWMHYSGP